MRDTSPSCPDIDFEAAPVRTETQTVASDWIDYNGHMNVAYYTLAFDKAFDDFLENFIGLGVSFVERSRFGPMALQMQTCYVGELLEGEAFHVRVYLVDFDEKRMHFFGEMISEATGDVAATYESLGMNVDLDARKGAPYPDWAIARLAKLKAAQATIERPARVGQPLGIRRKD